MFPSQRTTLRRLWRQGPLPVVLALVLLAAWVAPAQMQGPVAPAPQGLAVCGSPRFQAKAAELRRTIDWKPLSQDGLRAQGKLGSEGQVLADTVGQPREFWASDFTTSPGTFYTLTATCKAVGAHAYLYLEDGQTVAESVLTDIIDQFDTTIYPTDTLRFGDEPNPGIDGDALVYLLLLDIRDRYIYDGTYVAGYFYALNEFLNDDLPVEYRYSNEKEILYIDLNPAIPGTKESYGTVAHEFEHMIHWWMDADGGEETWVDEGCADLAQYLCGYGHPISHLYTGSPSQPGFLEEPDHQLTLTGADWNSTPHILASYGAAYMWTLYLWEQYGPDAILALVDEEADGIAGVSNALATAAESDDFKAAFRRWVVANYLDDGSGVYGYTNIELLASGPFDYSNSFPRPAPEWTHSSYPVGYTSRAVNHWAADAVKLTGFGAGDLNLNFNGANDNAFAAFVVSSTSANLDPGSNTVSEMALDGAWYGSTTVPTTGTLAFLLVPASLSQAGDHGYVYSARLGGAMSSYLPLVMRPVATPTPPPTPKPGPRPGHWDDGEGGDFYVTTDSQYVRNFRIAVYVPGCTTYYIWRGVDVPITNNQFSFTGSFSGSGTFTSVTTANIVSALNAFYISGCGFVYGGPWPSTATWQNYSQPDIRDVGTDLFQVAPAGTPEPGAAVKVRQATVD